MDFQEQINRIKAKFKQAKAKDKKREVFGADDHFYKHCPVLSDQEVATFEKDYNITLPSCYKVFLQHIGDCAAGPFYGMYALSETVVTSPLNDAKISLPLPVNISSRTTKSQWDELVKEAVEWDWKSTDPVTNDLAYDSLTDHIYAGILPLGYQGCTYHHALIINGDEAGKVIYLDNDLMQPLFTHENNFLDWYERWLDEILSGFLMSEHASYFGYYMAGSAEDLLTVYETASEEYLRENALLALGQKHSVSLEIAQKIEPATHYDNDKMRHAALKILTKNHPDLARPALTQHLEGDDADCKQACDLIKRYALNVDRQWFDITIENIKKAADIDRFLSLCTLLQRASDDYSHVILPFCQHKNPKLREAALNQLSIMTHSERFIESFKRGMADDDKEVVERALVSVGDIKDDSLLPSFMTLFKKFETRYNKVGFEDSDNYLLYCISQWFTKNDVSAPAILEKIDHYQGLWMDMINEKSAAKRLEQQKEWEELKQDKGFQKEMAAIMNDTEEDRSMLELMMEDKEFLKLFDLDLPNEEENLLLRQMLLQDKDVQQSLDIQAEEVTEKQRQSDESDSDSDSDKD